MLQASGTASYVGVVPRRQTVGTKGMRLPHGEECRCDAVRYNAGGSSRAAACPVG